MEDQDAAERYVKLYEFYRDYFKHEDTLRGQRLAAWLTVQGLLLTAFGVSINVRFSKLENTQNASEYYEFISWLLVVISIVGVAVSLYMLFRDRVQNVVVSDLKEKVRQIQDQQIANGLEKECRFWIENLPEWHYRSFDIKGGVFTNGTWLRVLAFYHIFLVAWLLLLVLTLRFLGKELSIFHKIIHLLLSYVS